MLFLLIYLIAFMSSVNADLQSYTENPEIRITPTSSDLYTGDKTYTVLKDKYLYIVLENIYATGITCRSYASKETGLFVQELNIGAQNYTVAKQVTEEMSTKWKCTVYSSQPAWDIMFYVHVKMAKHVTLKLNQIHLNYTTADLSEVEDGRNTYKYETGEIIDLSCNTKEFSNSLSLAYYNAFDDILFETGSIYNFIENGGVKFRALMNEVNHNSYIDCIYNTSLGESYVFRTVFIHQHGHKKRNEIKVSVNGSKLIPYWEKSVQNSVNIVKNYKFHYKFIPGETLYVCCENIKNHVTIKEEEDITIVKKRDNKITFSTVLIRDRNITCISENENKQIVAYIKFVSDLLYGTNELRVTGLNPKNIIYQYSKTDHHWVILYQFIENENLTLTCVSWNSPSITWFFDGKITNKQTYTSKNLVFKPQSTQATFTLTEKYNGSKISCVQNIHLTGNVRIIVTAEIQLQLMYKPNIGLSFNDESLVMIIGIIVVFIMVTIMSICVIAWRKKTKELALMQNAYEDLQSDNSPIPAYPSQWENQYENPDETKSNDYVMLDNSDYSSNTKAENNVTNEEPQYSEIDDVKKPYNSNCNEIYRKVNDGDSTRKINNYDSLRRSGLTQDVPPYWNNNYDNFKNIKTNNTFKQNNLNLDNADLYNNIDKPTPVYAQVNRPKSSKNTNYVNTNINCVDTLKAGISEAKYKPQAKNYENIQ